MLRIVGSHIESDLNPGDFVFMHKAELESVLTNSRLLNAAVEIFDRVGSILLGVAGTLFSSVPDASVREIILYALFGLMATGYGYYSRRQKNKLVEKTLKERLDK